MLIHQLYLKFCNVHTYKVVKDKGTKLGFGQIINTFFYDIDFDI